jgi:hypothetical protein
MKDEKSKEIIKNCFEMFCVAGLTVGECREVIKDVGLYLDDISNNVVLQKESKPIK